MVDIGLSENELMNIAGAGGAGKGGGGGGGAIIAPDNLQSNAMVSILDVIGEGQIGGLVAGAQSIFFNNTPVQNVDGSWNFSIQTIDPVTGLTLTTPTGFAYDFRDGQQSQVPISGFTDIETPRVVGVKVVAGQAPVVTSVTNPNTDAVRLIVSTPSLQTQDTTNGNVSGSSVSFQFDVSTNGLAYRSLSGPLAISGKVSSMYQAAYQYALPKTDINGNAATFWNISMTRITPNSLVSNVSNDIMFSDCVEIINSQLSYPNTALIGMTINSNEFTSIPTRSYMVNGLYIKVPSNYTPPNMSSTGVWTAAVYAGVWDGTFKLAISSNPAWVMYDLLTEPRYGLGQYITPADVNSATLYQIGQYCDGMVSDGFGGLEPRFTVNTAIQTQAEAYKIISDLSSAFRGMAYWRGQVNFTQDSPTSPSMIFTPANVVDGVFNYAGASRKDRHSVVQVTWNNPLEYYKQTIEYVENPTLVSQLGIRKMDLSAFGCTSRAQAHRAGLWVLYTEEFESSFVTFRVGIDSSLCLPGDVVKVQDPSRAGKRMGGRLVSCTATSAVLDAPVTLSAQATAPTLSVRLPDGTFADVVLNQSNVTTANVTWNTPLTQIPTAGSMWIIAEANLTPLLVRILGIAQSESAGEYTITAVEYNPTKYATIDGGAVLQTSPVSTISSTIVVAPANITFVESPYQVSPGMAGTQLSLSWSGNNASFYRVTWSRTGVNQTNPVTTTTSSPSFDLLNALAGNYSFTIVAVNSFGLTSQPTYVSHSTAATLPAPSGLTLFAAVAGAMQVMLNWAFPTNVLNSDIVEVWSCTTGNQTDATLLTNQPFPVIAYVDGNKGVGGVIYYYARVKNASGLYSGWSSTTVTLVQNPSVLLAQLNNSITANQLTTSLSTALTQVSAMGSAQTYVDNQTAVYLAAGNTLAQSVQTSISSGVSQVTATLQGVNADMSTQVAVVQARLSTGDIAVALTAATATADALAGVQATQVIKVQANGTYAGMAMSASGTAGSAVAFSADMFQIALPGSGTGAVPVFTTRMLNGVNTVAINGQLIVAGTITAEALNITGGLSAISSNIGTMTAGILKSADNKFVIDLTNKYISITV